MIEDTPQQVRQNKKKNLIKKIFSFHDSKNHNTQAKIALISSNVNFNKSAQMQEQNQISKQFQSKLLQKRGSEVFQSNQILSTSKEQLARAAALNEMIQQLLSPVHKLNQSIEQKLPIDTSCITIIPAEVFVQADDSIDMGLKYLKKKQQNEVEGEKIKQKWKIENENQSNPAIYQQEQKIISEKKEVTENKQDNQQKDHYVLKTKNKQSSLHSDKEKQFHFLNFQNMQFHSILPQNMQHHQEFKVAKVRRIKKTQISSDQDNQAQVSNNSPPIHNNSPQILDYSKKNDSFIHKDFQRQSQQQDCNKSNPIIQKNRSASQSHILNVYPLLKPALNLIQQEQNENISRLINHFQARSEKPQVLNIHTNLSQDNLYQKPSLEEQVAFPLQKKGGIRIIKTNGRSQSMSDSTNQYPSEQSTNIILPSKQFNQQFNIMNKNAQFFMGSILTKNDQAYKRNRIVSQASKEYYALGQNQIGQSNITYQRRSSQLTNRTNSNTIFSQYEDLTQNSNSVNDKGSIYKSCEIRDIERSNELNEAPTTSKERVEKGKKYFFCLSKQLSKLTRWKQKGNDSNQLLKQQRSIPTLNAQGIYLNSQQNNTNKTQINHDYHMYSNRVNRSQDDYTSINKFIYPKNQLLQNNISNNNNKNNNNNNNNNNFNSNINNEQKQEQNIKQKYLKYL